MTDDEQDFFNKSIGKLEKEIIALKKEYQAECHRADELEDSLQTSWRNESKLKKLLKEYKKQLSEIKDAYVDLTTQDEYGSYYIDEAKLFVEVVGKTIKDYDELELKQDEVLNERNDNG